MKRWFDKWIPKETRTRFLSRLAGAVFSFLYSTLRITTVHEERIEEMIQKHGGVILVTWHGRCSIHFTHFAGRGYYALISRSNDGELLSAVSERWGWKLIRGSTGRRGVEALRTGLNVLSQPGTVVALTPDGPRGPRYIAKPGMLYLAQKSGKPIIPVGVGAAPRKLFRSWDTFMLPLPFACVHIEYGEPMYISPEDNLDLATLEVQNQLNALLEKADRAVGVVSPPSPEAATETTTHQNA